MVYPNPVKDLLNIELPESFASPKISVIDIQGRTVMSVLSSSRSMSLDLSNLSSGNYILLLEQDETMIHHKIIVE